MKGSITRRNFGKFAGAALGAGLLSGCSSNSQDSSKDTSSSNDEDQEEVQLTCFSQLANYSGDQTGWGATFLKDRFNIDLTIVPDTDGAYQTRMENGNLGDLVVWKANGSDYQNAVDKGKLFDWDEDSTLDDYGKDMKSELPDALEANKELNSDGKIHGIGNNVTNQSGQHDLFIYEWSLRWDLYQKLGHPAIKSLDSLEDVLKKMQALCPTGDDGKKTYACSLWPDWDGDMVMYVSALVAGYWGYDGFGIGHYDSQTGKFYDCLADGSPYLTSLKFFNKLYREGPRRRGAVLALQLLRHDCLQQRQPHPGWRLHGTVRPDRRERDRPGHLHCRRRPHLVHRQPVRQPRARHGAHRLALHA